MKHCGDDFEWIKKKIAEWDEGLNSIAGIESEIYMHVLSDVLEYVRETGNFRMCGSCCCSSHPPDKNMTVHVREHVHGIDLVKDQPDLCKECGYKHPGGTCYDS